MPIMCMSVHVTTTTPLLARNHRFTASELLKSEKEYVSRLNYALLQYVPTIFESGAPRALRGQRETLLGNLEDIWEFHSK